MSKYNKPSKKEVMDAIAFMAAAFDKKVDCEKFFSDREKKKDN